MQWRYGQEHLRDHDIVVSVQGGYRLDKSVMVFKDMESLDVLSQGMHSRYLTLAP